VLVPVEGQMLGVLWDIDDAWTLIRGLKYSANKCTVQLLEFTTKPR